MDLRTIDKKNARNTHAAEYLWLYSLIQSTCPGVLTEENHIGVGTNISRFIHKMRIYDSINRFEYNSECSSFVLINL